MTRVIHSPTALMVIQKYRANVRPATPEEPRSVSSLREERARALATKSRVMEIVRRKVEMSRVKRTIGL